MKKRITKRDRAASSENRLGDLRRYLKKTRNVVDRALLGFMPAAGECPPSLRTAMAYSLMAGGKRFRPILALAAAETCGGDRRAALPAACALEYVHTYSLIHDDLPAMDDDDFRRGKPTSHKVFGEARAILAGDALLTRAFDIIASSRGLDHAIRLAQIAEIARAAGAAGMVGGQTADIEAEGKKVGPSAVLAIHRRKTGALITASVRVGALAAGAKPPLLKKLSRYGEYLGAAFQIADDILDEEGELSTMGKTPGSDRRRGKATFPAAVGLEKARREAGKLGREAKRALNGFGSRARVLEEMVEFVLTRKV